MGDADRGSDVLDDVCGVHAEMSEIRTRHRDGIASTEDGRRYVNCWRALALRRSPGRRTGLPREIDVLLDERARLQEEIRHERTRQEVEAIFQVAPEGETPTSGAGSSVPR